MSSRFFDLYRSYFELDHRQAKAYLWLIVLTALLIASPLATYYWYPDPHRINELRWMALPAEHESPVDVVVSTGPPFKKYLRDMTAEDWQKAGLPAYLAKRIMKYQVKVKPLRSVDELYRVYGMDTVRVKQVSAYLLEERVPVALGKQQPVNGKGEKKRTEYAVIDINTADTSALEALPAIGPVLSKRLIRYRQLLQGFVSKKQYAEVYGISADALKVLEEYTQIRTSAKVCRLGQADYKSLSGHFYLSGKDAGYITSQLKANPSVCWEDLKPGLESKASDHLEFLNQYFPCR